MPPAREDDIIERLVRLETLVGNHLVTEIQRISRRVDWIDGKLWALLVSLVLIVVGYFLKTR